MKRWIIVATVLGILLLSSASVLADPTNVGGGFSEFTSSNVVPRVFPGKGIGFFPGGGGPFAPALVLNSLLSPTNVGGG